MRLVRVAARVSRSSHAGRLGIARFPIWSKGKSGRPSVVRYDYDVRFRLNVAVWMEAESLANAQAALGRVEKAAHDALGHAARTDDATGALSQGEITPADRAAADALTAEDLGPGISSRGFVARLPPREPEH